MLHSATLALVSAAALFSPATPNKYPPAPDFQKRVDYVAWVKQLIRTPDKQNAYPALVRFMPGLPGSDVSEGDWPEFAGMTSERRDPNVEPRWPGPMPWFPSRKPGWEDSYKRTKKVVAAYGKASAKNTLSTAIPLDGARDDKPNRLVHLRLPHLEPLEQCARGTLEHAWRVKKGDASSNALLKAFEINLRIAGQLRESPFAPEHITAYVIRDVTYDHIRWAFAHGVLTEKHAARLLATLEEVDDEPLAGAPILQAQCAIWLDALQYVFGPLGGGTKVNGNRYQEVTGQTMGAGNRFALGARLEADPVGSANAIIEAHKGMEMHMKTGFRHEHAGAIHTLVQRMISSSQINKGLLLAEGHEYSSVYAHAARAELQRRGVQTLARIFAHKAQHKKWPQKLTDLGKKAKKTSADVFAEDKPFIYEIVAGQPVLYSVGIDGDDDGGMHDPSWSDNDYVIWPMPGSEEFVRASRLNRLPKKKLTRLADITAEHKGKERTVAALVTAVASQPSQSLGIRHSIMLKDGDATLEMYFDESLEKSLSPRQKIEKGARLRAIVTVEEYEGRTVLRLTSPEHLAIEE